MNGRASRLLGRLVAAVVVLGVAMPGPALAQDATPAGGSDEIALVAGGLANPRGFAWDEAGVLHVALAGTGGTTMSGGDSPMEQADGPVMGGASASVVRIENGCGVPVASGLPSTRGMSGHDQGPAAVAFLGEQLYVLQDAAAGMEDIDPNRPNGVYAVNPDGSVRLMANLTAWINANPVAHVPYDQTTLGEPFAMVSDGEALWVVEANNGQVLRITPDGAIFRVADLSQGHPVPTAIALAPDGGAYVGFLTPAPYVDGSSKIVKVGADGAVSDVWTGLTMVTGVAVGPDGALYALEMATGNIDQPPYTTFGTGRVVRQTGPAAMAEVATGLDYPIAMAFGPDGGLYVATPAFGGDEVPGGIVRLDVSASQPLVMPGGLLERSTCAAATDGTPTASPVAGPATPPAAPPAEMATAPAAATTAATPEPNDGGKGATGSLAVTIQNFAFNPATLSVPAGTVVTWTNRDTVPHTATSTQGIFDSGNLNPGQSFSYTFEQAGSYSYVCQYHPNMQGTVTVT